MMRHLLAASLVLSLSVALCSCSGGNLTGRGPDLAVPPGDGATAPEGGEVPDGVARAEHQAATDSQVKDAEEPAPPAGTVAWLEDQPGLSLVTRTQQTPISKLTGWPRNSTGSLKQTPTAEQLATFDMAMIKPFGASTIAAAQAINPDLAYSRIFCPQEYQGWSDAAGKTGNGYNFDTTGPISANGSVFAGHWLYKPRTTATQSLTAAATTLTVASVANIKSGQYVVIYDGNFLNAEHCQVTGLSGTTLTLQRGYKSAAVAHASGSFVAMHQLGNGSGEYNWAYNQSTACPPDGAGKKVNQWMASWLAENYDRDANGGASPARVDGVLFDSDAHLFIHGGSVSNRNCDADNDGVVDYGVLPNGTNVWGLGMDAFYDNTRAAVDARGRTNVMLLVGVAEAGGLKSANAGQMEGAPDHIFDESGSANPSYDRIDSYISVEKLQAGFGAIAPRATDNHTRVATKTYPGSTGASSNAASRFTIAWSTLFDAFASFQNGFDVAFRWYDYWAVVTDRSSPDFGKAVSRANPAQLRANKHWLGAPLGSYRRVYAQADFELADNLLQDGEFETDTSGWSGSNATISRVTSEHYSQAASLRVVPSTASGVDHSTLDTMSISGPKVTLAANTDYVICFAAKAEGSMRPIRPRVGGAMGNTLFIPTAWSKQVVHLRPTASTSGNIRFDFGQTSDPLWIDRVQVFKGNVNVFRRDYEKGIVLVNATGQSQTIALAGSFRRIQGLEDPSIDNGQTVTQVTLPAFDGAMLLRP